MKTYQYTILLYPDGDTGGYSVGVPVFPGIATQGESIEEAIAMAKDAIRLHIETLQAEGQPVPEEKVHPLAIVINIGEISLIHVPVQSLDSAAQIFYHGGCPDGHYAIGEPGSHLRPFNGFQPHRKARSLFPLRDGNISAQAVLKNLSFVSGFFIIFTTSSVDNSHCVQALFCSAWVEAGISARILSATWRSALRRTE